MNYPNRGEIWLAGLDPVKGHEQGRTRPVLVISANEINLGPSGLCIVVPLTTKNRHVPGHVQVKPPEGGLNKTSYVMCEQVRCISRDRLMSCFNQVSTDTLKKIEMYLKVFLCL